MYLVVVKCRYYLVCSKKSCNSIFLCKMLSCKIGTTSCRILQIYSFSRRKKTRIFTCKFVFRRFLKLLYSPFLTKGERKIQNRKNAHVKPLCIELSVKIAEIYSPLCIYCHKNCVKSMYMLLNVSVNCFHKIFFYLARVNFSIFHTV